MTEAIAFPDAETLAVSYLDALLDVPVSTRVPTTRPASFVRVARVGGTRRDIAYDRPWLVFECWAATTTEAADLARLARAYISALPGQSVNGVWVSRVDEIAGPQFFPDPTSDTPRYQFTSQLSVRGVPL